MKLKTAINLFNKNVEESITNNKPFKLNTTNYTVVEVVNSISWDNLSLKGNILTVKNGHKFKLSEKQEDNLYINLNKLLTWNILNKMCYAKTT